MSYKPSYEATKQEVRSVVARCTIPTSTVDVAIHTVEQMYGVRYEHEKYVTGRKWIKGRVSVTWVERALNELQAEGLCHRVDASYLWGAAKNTTGWMSHTAYVEREERRAADGQRTEEAAKLNRIRAEAQRIVLRRHEDEVATEIERLTLEAQS